MSEQLQIWVLCEKCHDAHEIGYAAFFERPVQNLAESQLLGPAIYFFVGKQLTTDI